MFSFKITVSIESILQRIRYEYSREKKDCTKGDVKAMLCCYQGSDIYSEQLKTFETITDGKYDGFPGEAKTDELETNFKEN